MLKIQNKIQLKIYSNTLFDLYTLQFMCWLVSDWNSDLHQFRSSSGPDSEYYQLNVGNFARLAHLDKRWSAERKAAGSNRGRTNTQGV